MTILREKEVVSLKLQGSCPTPTTSYITAGAHKIVIDEPIRGGTDRGPTPLHTMIAALIGSTNVILHRIAQEKRISIHDLHMSAEAVLDHRGALLQQEVAVPFPRVKLRLSFSTDADDNQLVALEAGLETFCPVSKIFRQAGTEVESLWNVKKL